MKVSKESPVLKLDAVFREMSFDRTRFYQRISSFSLVSGLVRRPKAQRTINQLLVRRSARANHIALGNVLQRQITASLVALIFSKSGTCSECLYVNRKVFVWWQFHPI